MKMVTKVDMILTEKDLPDSSHVNDPKIKHFYSKLVRQMNWMETVIYHAPDGRKKVLKSRDPNLPMGWIDYSVHIDWEVKDNEPFPYHFHRQMMGEAYMMCNECGARLCSFDGKEDADRSCPYRGTKYGKLYGCE